MLRDVVLRSATVELAKFLLILCHNLQPEFFMASHRGCDRGCLAPRMLPDARFRGKVFHINTSR